MANEPNYDRRLENLVKAALHDFEYPTDDAKKAAHERLAHVLDNAVNEWIEANCAF